MAVGEIEEEQQDEVQTKHRKVRAMIMIKQLKKNTIAEEKQKQEESMSITLGLS